MFGTSGIRGTVGDRVTADLALDVGRALASGGYATVVVGRDARDTGEMLEHALVAGLQECGATVIRAGVVTTPTLARGVPALDADAGVVVTASHNPAPDNGLKLWGPTGRAFGPDRRERIARRLREDDFDPVSWDAVGEARSNPSLDATHRAALREATTVDGDVHVVVDVGNGTGRLTADVLTDLGCRVETLNGQRDGRFPARPSEPTAETCAGLRTYVAESEADFGVAHDGDADRMMAVDETGSFLSGDVLLALFARERAAAGDRVAAPVNTSLAVDDALEAVGATVTRTRVGDGFVAQRCRDSDVVFGGEPSGAWMWPDEASCPDGPLAACKLTELVDADGPLSELAASVETLPIRRAAVETPAKAAVMDRVANRLRDHPGEVQELDGVRVETDDGWLLVRASGTQPLIRLTAEARSGADADRLLEEARAIVDDCIRNDSD